MRTLVLQKDKTIRKFFRTTINRYGISFIIPFTNIGIIITF